MMFSVHLIFKKKNVVVKIPVRILLNSKFSLYLQYLKNKFVYFLIIVFLSDLQSDMIHKLNYQELDRAATRLSLSILKQIHNRNSQPNSDGDWVIAVCLSPSDALILTLLAIWKTGAAYLPIDKCAPPSRVKHIITEAKPVLIITEDNNSKFFLNVTLLILRLV